MGRAWTSTQIVCPSTPAIRSSWRYSFITPGRDGLDEVDVVLAIIKVDEVEDRSPETGRYRMSGELLPCSVEERPPALPVDPEDHLADILDDRPIASLAVAQRLGRRLCRETARSKRRRWRYRNSPTKAVTTAIDPTRIAAASSGGRSGLAGVSSTMIAAVMLTTNAATRASASRRPLRKDSAKQTARTGAAPRAGTGGGMGPGPDPEQHNRHENDRCPAAVALENLTAALKQGNRSGKVDGCPKARCKVAHA